MPKKKKSKKKKDKLLNLTKKEKERSKTFIIIILFIALLVISLSGTKIWLYVNFLFGNDVIVRLSADQEHFSLLNGQKDDVEFTARITTNPFCSATCTSNWQDISQNSLIDSANFDIRPGKPFVNSYGLTTPKYGEGQVLYRLTMECKAKESFFCHTKKDSTQRSILVTVQHTLNNQEKQIKDSLLPKLLDLKDQIEANENLLLTYDDKAYFFNNITTINNTYLANARQIHLKNKDSLQLIKLKWDEQNYIDSNKEYAQLTNSLLKINASSMDSLELDYNNLQSTFNLLENSFYEISSLDYLNSTLINSLNDKIDQYNFALKFIHEKNSFSQKNAVANDLATKVSSLALDSSQSHLNEVVELSKQAYNESINLCNLNITCLNLSVNDDYDITCNNIQLLHNISNSSIPLCIPPNYSINQIEKPSFYIFKNITYKVLKMDFSQPLSKCCVLGQCSICCTNCQNENFPIVFVHGHDFSKDVDASYSMDIFIKMQNKLEEEGFLDAGAISLYTPHDENQGIWGFSSSPISLKISYYFDIFKNPDNYVVVQAKTENIDTYALRLKDLIETVKFKTGKNKVILISHSMGGLVTRRYLDIFGTDYVDKVILINVPNKGIKGSVLNYCNFAGEKLECRDMEQGSLFLNKLNRKSLPKIPIYNIYSTGCVMDNKELGDGVVLESNSYLEDATNIKVTGKCDGINVLHNEILFPQLYPETYKKIVEIIKIS